ncbi:uncharacterized protein B0T23DRAFT_373974 [Neurospora hispaniola]|uniref:Uncharacterized protein n=1 Tax=Neurospora hispaniola TaxID=588809 RepID=A0AAJ0ICM5_9PEZI|nr:hypothetical protein B0T23DRAFT_373974 [Neurospora hispaniola]
MHLGQGALVSSALPLTSPLTLSLSVKLKTGSDGVSQVLEATHSTPPLSSSVVPRYQKNGDRFLGRPLRKGPKMREGTYAGKKGSHVRGRRKTQIPGNNKQHLADARHDTYKVHMYDAYSVPVSLPPF